MGREERACRLEGRDVRRRSARSQGNIMDVVKVKDDEDILVTKTGGDGEATGKVGGRPVFSGNGSFPPEPSDRPGWERGVDGEGQDARAGARGERGDGAKNGIRA